MVQNETEEYCRIQYNLITKKNYPDNWHIPELFPQDNLPFFPSQGQTIIKKVKTI